MSGKWQVKDHEAERLLFDGRLLIAFAIIVLLFVALVLKLVNLQVTQYEYFFLKVVKIIKNKSIKILIGAINFLFVPILVYL